jgi:hypothetical protein
MTVLAKRKNREIPGPGCKGLKKAARKTEGNGNPLTTFRVLLMLQKSWRIEPFRDIMTQGRIAEAPGNRKTL